MWSIFRYNKSKNFFVLVSIKNKLNKSYRLFDFSQTFEHRHIAGHNIIIIILYYKHFPPQIIPIIYFASPI